MAINYTAEDLITEIDKIVWDDDTTPLVKLHRVQGLLYQHEMNCDARSTEEEYFAPEEEFEKFYRG
jgi:hypothetical protein